MSRQLLGTGFFAVCLCMLACEPSGQEQTSVDRTAVLNGEAPGIEDNSVVAIDAIDSSGTIWSCSGTLVAPNLVLTARHCVSNFSVELFTCDSQGNLASGPGGKLGALDKPSDISIRSGSDVFGKVIARGKEIIAADTNTICHNDIAMVILDRTLADLPVAQLRLFDGVVPRDRIRVAGYGINGSTSGTSTGVKYSRKGLSVARVGSSSYRPVGDDVPPRTFTIEQPVECPGDSGGPAFSADTNAVVGVFSQFTGTCTSPNTTNYYTEVAPFRDDVIMPAFNHAGYEPWLETNAEPGLYGTGGGNGSGGSSPTGGASPALQGGASSLAGGAAATGGTSEGGTTLGTLRSDANAAGGTLGTGGTTANSDTTATLIVYNRGTSSAGSCACRAAGTHRAPLWGSITCVAYALTHLRRYRRGRR